MENENNLIADASATLGRVQYQAIITSGGHTIISDEPEDMGGKDTGMAPYGLLLGSLASCTIITLRMYIERKMWVIDEIKINLELFKTPNGVFIESKISFTGEVTDEQRKRLLTIADACPIHKLLVGNIDINNQLAGVI